MQLKQWNKLSIPPEQLAKAVGEVKCGRMTTNRASKLFTIPYNTIDARVKGKRGVKSTTIGQPTALPSHVEINIADGIKELGKNGLSLSRKDVLNLVREYVRQNGCKTPLKDGIPQSD